MEQVVNSADKKYQTLIERYQQALNALDNTDQPNLAEVLDVLLVRDAIQAALSQYTPLAHTLITLKTLDQRLKTNAPIIATHINDLLPWQEQLAVEATAWWWPSPQSPKRAWWSEQNWLWSMGSIIFLSASASLVLNTAARFWDGGIASAGTIPIVAQSVLTLIAGQGALTSSGKQAWQTFLKKQGVSEDYWHEWSCAAAGGVFLLVAAIHGSLPQVGTWYNTWGWEHYQKRQLDSALSHYRTALSLRPDYPDAHFHSGLVHEDLQQYTQAQESYQLVVQSNSDDVPLGVWLSAHNNLARLYLLEGNNRNAAPLLLRAQQDVTVERLETEAEIADVNYTLLKNLGWVRFNQERYREARENLEEAILFDQAVLQTVAFAEPIVSDRAAAYCLLAQVADAQQNDAEASALWQQCLAKAEGSNPDEDVWVGVYERREQEPLADE